MFLESKWHQEKYYRWFYRLENSKQGKVDVFRDENKRS